MKTRFGQFIDSIGWSPRQGLFFGVMLASILLVPMIVKYFGWTLVSVSEVLVGLTAIVVLVYTIETQGLRFEMVRQNQIGVQPVIVMSVHGSRHQHETVLINVGRGPAFGVQIDDVPVGEVAGDLAHFRDRIVGNVAKFGPVNFINPGNQIHVDAVCEITGVGNVKYVDFLPSLDPTYAKQNYELTINYQDLDGHHHQTKMRLGKDGVAIINRS